MKIGLVLEGGAMRGMYTAAVLDTLLKYNIQFDAVAGVSAGALFGVNFLSEQRGRVIRYNKRFNRDKKYMGLYPLLKEGNIVNTKYAYHDVPHKLDFFDDETFKKSSVPFYAVITNIESGKPEYVQIKSVFQQMDTLRASGSIPFVSKPVEINGNKYLDGGVADSIPFEWLSKKGCDKLVVILTRDMTYRKKPINKALTKFVYRKNPKFAQSIITRHDVYNQTVARLKQLESEGKVFVIRPSSPIEVGMIEKKPEKLQKVYDLGILDAENCINDLKVYMEQ